MVVSRRGCSTLEDVVLYRETVNADLDDRYQLHVVLQQQSMLGPWVALGLGAVLAGFVVYLVITNLVTSTNTTLSLERSLRITPDIAATTTPMDNVLRQPAGLWSVNATIAPQNRAANALLGGQGPALPQDRALGATIRRPQWPPWSAAAEPRAKRVDALPGSPQVAAHTLSGER